MRRTSVFVLATLSLCGQTPQSNQRPSEADTVTTLQGAVVNSINQQPLGNVTLGLQSDGPVRPPEYVASSDSSGSFVFEKVRPGRYTLLAEKPGFLRQYYGSQRYETNGTPLTVSSEVPLKDLHFKLIPHAVIAGAVHDANGDPIAGVAILVLRARFPLSQRFTPVGAGLTNDVGEYRIANLAPGRYRLIAHRGALVAGQLRLLHARRAARVTPETPEFGYVNTYYPGSLDPGGAAEVRLSPGSELRGINIALQKVRVFRVRGRVVDDVTGMSLDATVGLIANSTEANVLTLGSLDGASIPGGTFEVTNVPPGHYQLIAQVRNNGLTQYSREMIDVSNRHVTDLLIRIPRPIHVAGSVRLLEQAGRQSNQELQLESMQIGLLPVQGIGLGPLHTARIPREGSFVLRDVTPDLFRVGILGIPRGWYLKAVLFGGREIPDESFDLRSGNAPLEIVLQADGAELKGEVLDKDKKPIPGAEVGLIAERGDRSGRMPIRPAITDQNGRFWFQGVMPGDYKILALQDESGAVSDPEFQRRFEVMATSIKLRARAQDTLTLKVISSEDITKAFGIDPNI